MLALCMEALLVSVKSASWYLDPNERCATLDTKVAQQRRSGRAVAEHSIFHDRFARPHRFKEIVEVIVAVAVSRRRNIFLVTRLVAPLLGA